MSQLNKADLVSTRSANANDKNFIFATWLRGLKYGNDWYNEIDSATYFSVYHQVLEAVLAKPDTKVTVSCLKDDPEVVLGYSVHTSDKLHWIFVKKAWRSIGIAKSLIPANIKTVTHLTTVGKSILKKYPEVKFNPFGL